MSIARFCFPIEEGEGAHIVALATLCATPLLASFKGQLCLGFREKGGGLGDCLLGWLGKGFFRVELKVGSFRVV